MTLIRLREKKANNYLFRCLILALLLWCVSCKKENNNVTVINYEDGVSTVIYDLAGSVGSSVSDSASKPFRSFYFRFKDSAQLWLTDAEDSAATLATNNWDIAFTSIYNAYVIINSGTNSGSPGYGGTGGGAIVYYDKSYEDVTEAPSDDYFAANDLTGVGWDAYPQPYNTGWYYYTLSTHIAVPIKNRTFVLKTAEGKFAKLQLINVYKGNPETVTDLYWPAPYFTFRYYVQQDGSRNLSTPAK